jgi:phage-related protein
MQISKCVYFATDSGRSPVEEFIEASHQWTQQKFFNAVDLLKKFDKKLPEPHAKKLTDDIYELRFIGGEGKVRVLYFFYHDDKVILTNAFIKKTKRTPKKEIELAESRRKRYLERMKVK